jgi:hypothetical protein
LRRFHRVTSQFMGIGARIRAKRHWEQDETPSPVVNPAALCAPTFDNWGKEGFEI